MSTALIEPVHQAKKSKAVGLRYKRFDLHVHTPASRDFEKGELTPSQLVEAAIQQGLSAVAITDHNSGEWIDKVKEAAKGTELTVFPGVEINASGGKEGGIHVIGIFDCDKTTKHIENLLSALKFKVSDYGKLDAVSPMSVVQVIKEIGSEQHKGLAVLAHANSSKGVLSDMSGVDRSNVIALKDLMAAEATDFNHEEKQNKKKRVCDLLSGNDSNFRRHLAVYQASDNPGIRSGEHGLKGIGSRFSYFKVDDDISLESLRQCFVDPDVRIKQPNELKTADYPRIISLEISDGFMTGQNIPFHEGLNSIFGGKGVGKSLIVELLRFGLDQSSQNRELQKDLEGKLSKRLGMLGKIRLAIQVTGGSKYLITRTYDGTKNPVECVCLDTQQPYTGLVSKLFPVVAYSQTEVMKIADDGNAQLGLIDKFIDTEQYLDRVVQLQKKLDGNGKNLIGARAAATEASQLRSDISTLAEHVKNISRSIKHRGLSEFEDWEAKLLIIERSIEYISRLEEQVEDYIDSLREDLPPDTGTLGRTDATVSLASKAAGSAHKSCNTELSRLRAKLAKKRSELEAAFLMWKVEYEQKKVKYEELLSQLGGDKKELEGKRRQLQRSLQDKQSALARCYSTARLCGKYRAERQQLLDALDKTKREYYEARRKKYEELSQLSNRKLNLTITHQTSREQYQAALRKLKRGSYLKDRELETLVEKVTPRELVDAMLDDKVEDLAKRTGLSEDNIRKLLEELRAKEDLAEVLELQHSVYADDTPSVKYRKDDGQYAPLSELSVGQKCTALLIIALLEGNMPIIIDQPEDSLDVLSVYEDIVLKLRTRKEERQFVLTTHNSSVAVASDSDEYLFVDSTESQGQVKLAGTIDRKAIREGVILGLEGGSKPYLLKAKKLNIKETGGAKELEL